LSEANEPAREPDAGSATPNPRPAGTWASRIGAKVKRLQGPLAAIAAVGALLGGLVGYWNAYRTVHDSVVPAVTGSAAPVDAGTLSIVVLPFANLTGDASQAYVADGLTATLTSDLARMGGAFVVDSASAQSYRDKALTAQQIGKALGVRFVLQGNVQRSADHLRINAQLADATTNVQLWADTFEGSTADLFAFQDQVTGRIAATMGHEMVAVAARESKRRAGDPKVADLLLRAWALSDGKPSLDTWRQVEALNRKALAIEPGNAQAMMGLASALAFEATNYGSDLGPDLREKTFREAMDLATRANALVPGDADYYRILAFYAQYRGDTEGNRRAAEAMVRLNPKLPSAYNVLATSYLIVGEPDKAIELLTKAVNLNRKNAGDVFLVNLCRAHFMAGDNAAAIEWCGKAIDEAPDLLRAHYFRAMAYALTGDDARARAEAKEVRRIDPGFRVDAAKMRADAGTPRVLSYIDGKVIPGLRGAGLLE
jgi:adenylate cyclase